MKAILLTAHDVALLPEKPGAYLLGSNQQPVYVGSTNNLRRRGKEHLPENETNSCLKRKRPGTMWYQECSSEAEARKLEKEWYGKYGHTCNEQEP